MRLHTFSRQSSKTVKPLTINLCIMKRWRISTWVLAIALIPLIPYADSLQEMEDFCRNQSASGGPPCHLQPCPCSPGDISLKRFETGSTEVAHCACLSASADRQHTRQKAVDVCDKQRQNKRQSCFVSRGDCPRGFEAIERFTDHSGNRFSACRDSRHEHLAHAPARPRMPLDQELLPLYHRLIARLESGQIGTPLALPQQTQETLSNSFPGNTLKHLSLIRTDSLEQGCFTDCNRIFCANDGRIERWTDRQRPEISRYLLHQIVHSARCEREGGREGFVKHWFQHLPDDVHARLQENKPLDADQIHFAMYMETHANSRAEALCRRLPGCQAAPTR